LRPNTEILKGTIDTHLHAGPSVFPRLMDAVGAAEVARKAGMRGIVIKHHHTPTVDRAYLVHRAVPEVEVYGGVVLNYAAGGLNPFAVDAALKLGAKVIWMPSVDARNHARHFGELGKYGSRLDYAKSRIYEGMEGITVFDEEGGLDLRVGQILDLVADADAAIATSHLDFEESRALVEEARRLGVKKMVATHVRFVTASLSIEEQKWMAERGVFLELCYSSLSPAWRSTTIDEVVGAIEEVGPEHYILASDLGQVHNPPPPEGLRIYVTILLERGVDPDDIRVMVKDNPERLLGLDG
jgi:predicted metal-dependent TIM-barrel fold hydrolase